MCRLLTTSGLEAKLLLQKKERNLLMSCSETNTLIGQARNKRISDACDANTSDACGANTSHEPSG